MGKITNKKLRTAVRAALLAAGAVFLLTIPGISARAASASKAGKNAAPVKQAVKGGADYSSGTEFDFTDTDEILGFLEGTWRLKAKATGEDYSELTFDGKGGVKLRRLSDGISCEGEISIEEAYWTGDAPIMNSYTLSFTDIPEEFTEKSDTIYPEDRAVASGRFLIGRAPGEDLLYLEENGNGISYIAAALFNENEENPDFDNAELSWLLHRKNSLDTSDAKTAALFEPTAEDGEFYGFAWGRDEDGRILIQKVKYYAYMTFEDFTNRHFMAGEFLHRNSIAAVPYTVRRRADLDGVLDTAAFDSSRALIMCRFTTDRMGRISSVRQVMKSYYGVYDLEDLDPDWSWNDECLIYNGSEYYPKDAYIYGEENVDPAMAGPIMDCEQVGNWIVVTCHRNPHASLYFLFNMDTGNFERVLHGANLTWQGDDVTTAYYSFMDTVYNYKGHVFASVDFDPGETCEIMDLSFNDKGTMLEVEYSRFKNGKETQYSEEFELPEEDDRAMYLYADYLRRPTPERWKAFADEAPEDAAIYVMVNPPAEVRRYLPWGETVTEGAADFAAAVPLLDDIKIFLCKYRMEVWDDEIDWVREKRIGEYEPAKGEAITWTLTVPEGIPTHGVETSRGSRKAQWMISPISGMSDVSGTFITEE